MQQEDEAMKASDLRAQHYRVAEIAANAVAQRIMRDNAGYGCGVIGEKIAEAWLAAMKKLEGIDESRATDQEKADRRAAYESLAFDGPLFEVLSADRTHTWRVYADFVGRKAALSRERR